MTAREDIQVTETYTKNSGLKRDEPLPPGPGSYTWKDFGSYLYHLTLSEAFILQTAHPVIDAAVTKDKKYKYDPWVRARNFTKFLWPVVYSRPGQAIEMGRQLRELHRSIKGEDKNGKRYHALDLEACSWVHMTGVDSTLPDAFRKKFNVRYSKLDQWIFKAFASGVRKIYPKIPESRRYIPLAWRAIKDAREHPGEYVI